MTMEPNPNPIRDHLLARLEPSQQRMARYREEVDAMLALQEKKLRWQTWYASGMWVFVVLLGTAFLVLGASRGDVSIAFWPIMTALFLLIGAAVELGKVFLTRTKVELLKEIKGLELQVRELKESMKS
jgi:hypothetical protein